MGHLVCTGFTNKHGNSVTNSISSLNTSHISIDTFLTTVGTIDYDRISKKFSNSFWSECLHLIKPFLLEHLKMHPEDIITFPIWGSSVFMMNSTEFKRMRFGAMGLNILTIHMIY